MDQTVQLKATRAQVRQLVASIPSTMLVSGRVQSATLGLCGRALLERIQAAFLVKMRGGTDEAGDKWPPLSPVTVAYRRARRNKLEGRRNTRPSQALTKRQQDRWWEVYRRALGRTKNKGRAAAIAWLVLKREGATTLLQKYGGQKVDILRDTSLLFDSLSPESPNSEQVFRVGPGSVTLGTTRKGALAHHHGAPSRNLPQRRLWPAVSRWPDSWWNAVTFYVKIGVSELLVSLLKGIK